MASHDNEQSSMVTAPSQAMSNEYNCPLLTLPPELRDYIYKKALIHESVHQINISGDTIDHLDEHKLTDQSLVQSKPSEPALLSTCKQIRHEALLIFYGGNIFQDSNSDRGLRKFIKWLTPEKRLLVRTLQLHTWKIHQIHQAYMTGSGFEYACVWQAQRRLRRTREWMQKNEISLPEEAIQVSVRLSDEAAPTWTNAPEGMCGLRGCCCNSLHDPTFVMTFLSNQEEQD